MFNRKETSFINNFQEGKKRSIIKDLIASHYHLSENNDVFLNKMESIQKNSFFSEEKFNSFVEEVMNEQQSSSSIQHPRFKK